LEKLFENALAILKGKIKCNLFIQKCGKLPRFHGYCKLKNKGKIVIGNRFCAYGKPVPVMMTTEEPTSKLLIGDNVFLNYGVDIGCRKSIRIGNNVKIGQYTSIMDNNYHLVDVGDDISGKEIIICDNVWIGIRCIVLPGVTIGKNSVIASGSIVTKDIPENVMAAGVPAKVIKKINIPNDWIRY
jgi:acetyltransferase-like isoleucine patch superfamily enzyme